MAQYITTLSFGTLSLHLSHTGQQVFSSRHYTTGGSSVGGIVFRCGQLDATFRAAMTTAVGDFHPVVECDSMLQVRELIVQGVCVGLLPSFGTHGLSDQDVVTCEFAPMKDYGRSLVLHWNNRQVRRRGIEESVIKRIAKALQRSSTGGRR